MIPFPTRPVVIAAALLIPALHDTAQAAPSPNRSASVIERANHAATVEPAAGRFLNAVQVQAFAEGALYHVATAPDRITDIALQPGGSIPIDAGADERALYVSMGEATLDGMRLEPTVLYVLRPGISATLRSQTGGRIILCGGEDFATPRHVWWNFVSSSRDRINQAKEDWKAGRFPTVPGDDKEFIPIPEVPKTVSYP